MKSLLALVTEVTDLVGLPRVSAVTSSTDQAARQFLSLANETVRELSRLPWPQLEPTHSFSTADGVSEYALPADFKSIIVDTLYSTEEYYRVRGSYTSAQWQRIQYGAQVIDGRYRFRIVGSPLKLVISPTPTGVVDLTMQYKSKYPVRDDADSQSRESFEQDTDHAIFEDELMSLGLKWRIRHAKGLEYAEDFNAYQLAKQTLLAQALASGEIPVAQRSIVDGFDPPIGYIPETGYGS